MKPRVIKKYFQESILDALKAHWCMMRFVGPRFCAAAAPEGLFNCYSQPRQLISICLLKKLTTPRAIHPYHVQHSLVASLVYGKSFPVYKDSQAEVYFKGVKLMNKINDQTKYPAMEIMPWIKYIPRWLAPWTGHCDFMKGVRNRLYDSLVDECDQEITAGRGTGCYIEKVLARQEELGLSRQDVSYLGATLMDAGAETSASLQQAFVLALLSYPERQKRIQDEIDIIVGSDRMHRRAFQTYPACRFATHGD
ncbi:hypothetical protein BYT27DRAFT_6541247 [Phlegmacium glaucopus]|nr:hypothetical protein BYT27DRAFT_6541247 [Phlegmacium glaucopus]